MHPDIFRSDDHVSHRVARTPTPEPAATAEKPVRPARRTSPFGALLLRLHFYAGVLVAPFLVVAALTGLAYTIAPQLDQVLYGDQLTVAQVGDRQLPLAEQVGAARDAHPEGSITSVRPATATGPPGGVLPAGARREAAHRLRRPVHRPRSQGS